MDLNIAPQESDRQLIEFLKHAQREFLIVGTKVDRLSGNQARNQVELFKREFGTDRLLPFSSKTGIGKEDLWKEIRAAAERMGTPAE
jgi:GTP-binding protein